MLRIHLRPSSAARAGAPSAGASEGLQYRIAVKQELKALQVQADQNISSLCGVQHRQAVSLHHVAQKP